MKDEDTFSKDRLPPTTSAHERGGDSDGHALSSPPVPQDTPSSTHLPRTGRPLTLRPRMRLLLVVLLVLIILAGGYGIFRAVSPGGSNPCPTDIENTFLDHPTEKPHDSSRLR